MEANAFTISGLDTATLAPQPEKLFLTLGILPKLENVLWDFQAPGQCLWGYDPFDLLDLVLAQVLVPQDDWHFHFRRVSFGRNLSRGAKDSEA